MRPRNALSKFAPSQSPFAFSIGALADACFAGYMQSFAVLPYNVDIVYGFPAPYPRTRGPEMIGGDGLHMNSCGAHGRRRCERPLIGRAFLMLNLIGGGDG